MKLGLVLHVWVVAVSVFVCAVTASNVRAANANIAGRWNYTENANITCTAFFDGFDPETETFPASGSGVMTIQQNGSNVSWSVVINGTSYNRSGTINGNQIQVSGPFVVPIGGSVSLTSNTFTAQGPVSADGATINLTGSGSASGSGNFEGIDFTFTCSGTSTATFTRPRVGFAAATSSGSESATSVNLPVTLSSSASWPITVQYSVTGGTATGGGVDYTLANGTLTFSAGQTSRNISLTVINDTLFEPNETIQVTLTSPTEAALGTTKIHTYTIIDNDVQTPSLTIGNAAINEGNSGTPNAVFTVTLSPASTQTVTASYSMANITATGGPTCSPGIDYVSTSGSLTFTPGQTAKQVAVSVCGDTVPEPNETFHVNLTSATGGAVIDQGQGTGTIINDDDCRKPPLDFDGDCKSDVSIYRDGLWIIQRSSDRVIATDSLGDANDIPVPADYDGDGKTDLAVYTQITGTWKIKRSSDAQVVSLGFGGPAFAPVPGDYDGDGKADVAVFSNDGVWSVLRSSDNQNAVVAHGGPGWEPVPADYDGDGKTDFAVHIQGAWSILRSSDGVISVAPHGGPGWTPVPADYDGDGKADVAVYHTIGAWAVLQSSDGNIAVEGHGGSAWTPVPADYDGDGKTDTSAYLGANGTWAIKQSLMGFRVEIFGGGPRDVPLN